MSNPGLKCSVTSCMFNQHGSDCELKHIQVEPCEDVESGSPAESMCGSYKGKS